MQAKKCLMHSMFDGAAVSRSQLPTNLWKRHKINYAQIASDDPILVISPHPDDESLGCGALLADAFDGFGAHIVVVTDGSGSHPGSQDWLPEDIGKLRRDELLAAVAELGGKSSDVTFAGLVDGQLYQSELELNQLVQDIVILIDRTGAKSVFLPSPLDAHADHKAIAGLADQISSSASDVRFFYYPIWSRWDKEPGFDKLEGTKCWSYSTKEKRNNKRAAIYCHLTQRGRVIRDDPDGFVIDPAMIDKFVNADEIYLEVVEQ